MELNIHSETGRLSAVIVHTPGREVSLVNPEIKEELLFDDIIFEEDARAEHLDMISLIRAAMPPGGQVFELLDLAVESLATEKARTGFITRLVEALPEENLHAVRSSLEDLDASELVRFVVEGTMGSDNAFALPPIPNLLFTRDLAVVAGSRIVLCHMAQEARRRETLLMEQILGAHPIFESSRGRTIRISPDHSIEGGDVLVAGPNTLLVGVSERTGFSGLMQVAEALLDPHGDDGVSDATGSQGAPPDGSIRTIIAVDIPKRRSSMHLDTLFTFASPDECVVFEPAILHRRDNVFVLTRGAKGIAIRPLPDLKTALEEACGRPFTFIPCGGHDLTRQYREQWTDGANLFALAPGVVIGYERNTHTFKAMADHGYRVMNQFEFVEMCAERPFDPSEHGRLAITFQGHELCRGRGGARCMTLPLRRNDSYFG